MPLITSARMFAWRSLASTLVGVALAAAGCAAPNARDPGAPRAVEVAPGVYAMQGAPGEVDSTTLGRVGNAGFVVGATGVLAIDTGTSYRHGRLLLDEIHRVTSKPVREVLITHVRQEFLFGTVAYREQGIPVAMHHQSAQLMASRCETCLKTLRRVLGEDEMRGTSMFKPDREFEASQDLDLIGRPVKVLYFDHSSGPGDIAVLDMPTRTLFAGGLLDWKRIPDIQDSEFPGWRNALDTLRRMALAAIVPGHGPVATRNANDVIDANERYLNQLEVRVLELLKKGAALSEVADSSSLDDFKDWDQYDTVHRRNASVLFVRKEREQMFE